MPDWFHAPSYWLARLLLQRGLGIVYFVAFLNSLNELPALPGGRGLLPVPDYLARISFREAPSLFHFRYSDRLLRAVALGGIVLSLAIVAGLPDRWPAPVTIALWLVLWALYLSIVNVGQTFYSFGWESLLLEAGFLAAFLGPADGAVPAPILWLFRWLLLRLEFGAGLIKMRGDRCWRDLTCLFYHHETQPMPNPLSWFFHHLPKPMHRFEVLGNHVAQLVLPFGLFLPQPVPDIAAALIVLTQCWLILSGNFSWLNFNTIAIALLPLRLDWLMWLAALSPAYAYSWLGALLGKLLENDRPTLGLFRSNPFPDRPPALVRVLLYRYRFTSAAEHRDTGAWWSRELLDEFLPPMRLPPSRANGTPD